VLDFVPPPTFSIKPGEEDENENNKVEPAKVLNSYSGEKYHEHYPQYQILNENNDKASNLSYIC